VRRLSSALQIPVPATVVFNYPTVRVLAQHLVQRMQLQPIEVPPLEKTNSADTKDVFRGLTDDLSEEDALQVLMGGKRAGS
jgi:hypothetical protein